MQFLAATSKLWGINTIWIDWCHYCSRVFPYNVNTSRQSTLSKNKLVGIILTLGIYYYFWNYKKRLNVFTVGKFQWNFNLVEKAHVYHFLIRMLTGHYQTNSKGFLKSKSFCRNLWATASPFAIDLITKCLYTLYLCGWLSL